MLITNLCIVGGIAYAGLRTLMKRRSRHKVIWLATPNGQTHHVRPLTEVHRHDERDAQLFRSYTVSLLSLGLSTIGRFGYPLISLTSVPLTVYGSVPLFEQAFATFFLSTRHDMAVVLSAVVIGTLTTQHYVLASLLTWIYDVTAVLTHRLHLFTQLFQSELEHSHALLSQLYGVKPPAVWVLVNGVGVEIPFQELRVGDTVVIRAGEVIPVDGTIVAGTAEVIRWLPNGSGQREDKRPGDHVITPTLVVSGNLSVCAERVS